MSQSEGHKLQTLDSPLSELEQLRWENTRLRELNRSAFDYIRSKVNVLLEVIGTQTLRPEELDDQSLIDFDPIGIVSQSFQYVLGNLRDTNSKLHFVNQEIQTIFDTVGAALLVLDPQRRVVAYNQKTRALLLDRDDEIHGRDCRQAVCRDREAQPPCLFDQVLATGREQHLQEWNLGPRSYNVVGRPMYDADGNVTHVVLAYTDITARRNAEMALLEALTETQEVNAKIHGILRSASDGMLITDREGQIVLINQRAEELFGLSPAEGSRALTLETLSHVKLVQLIRHAPDSGQDPLTEDLPLPGPAGRQRIYQARVTAIRSPEGACRGCITFLHDVTQQREVDRMKSDFVSTAAHELRTPLATIIGYADLLLTRDPDVHKNLYDYLQLIQDKAERLADIVGDLLDISRIEAGEVLQLNPKPCRLDSLCHELIGNFQRQTDRHHFVENFPDEPPLEIFVDRYAFIQILENILSNAVKYSPDGGEIRLVARRSGSCCELSISDQGIGMTASQLDRVYEKFYRADATNTAISGTGLGMTIVRYLVEAQNGQVQVESAIGQGTRVRIRVPLADDPACLAVNPANPETGSP